MATFRVMSNLKWTTGLPEDTTVNTFHVNGALGTVDWLGVRDAVKGFFDDLGGILSNLVATNGHRVRAYNLADVEPRAPVFDDTWNLATALTGETAPPQDAVVLSYEGARVSGEPQARRRGRMYIGPLNLNQMVNGRMDTAVAPTIASAFLDFLLALDSANAQFVIYSRTDTNTVVPVTAWIDDTIDTQRRRQLTPTTRYSIDLVP